MKNTLNHINTVGYIYDLAGNLIRGQKPDGTFQRFEYDSSGRLINVKDDAGNILQSSGYGSSRQRVVTNEGGVLKWYVWGGSSVLAEYTATTWGSTYNWVKSYIYAGSRLLSTFTKNGASETLEYHHPDRLGTKLVTNNVTNTSYEQSTLPFGTALNAESSGFSNQVFTSYDRSAVASLDYAVNRSYSSGQGRFTSVDPIGMGASSLGSPQSLNLYSYCQNNPIDFTDPSGLFIYGPPKEEPQPDWEGFLRFLLDSLAHSRSGGSLGGDTGGGGTGGAGTSTSQPPSQQREINQEKLRKAMTTCLNRLFPGYNFLVASIKFATSSESGPRTSKWFNYKRWSGFNRGVF